MIKYYSFILFGLTAILYACGSSSNSPKNIPSDVKLPNWVLTDNYEDGISSAQCVRFSGNVSLDMQEVTAKGRAALAQQINLRAQVMDKTYQSKAEAEGKVVGGSVFESVSKQLSDQVLVGSKIVRTDFGDIQDNKYFCGLVAINKDYTEKLFESIVESEQSPQVSAQDKDILYQEFKAYKAQQELSDFIDQ